jgi:hypothetical protein
MEASVVSGCREAARASREESVCIGQGQGKEVSSMVSGCGEGASR